MSGCNWNNFVFVDPAKLASAITEVIQSIFVSEEEVNKAFTLASKREFAKVCEVTNKTIFIGVMRFYQAKCMFILATDGYAICVNY